MLFNFLRNRNCVNKISSRKSALYKFLIKICLESFVFSYHFIIYLESSTKVFFITYTSRCNSSLSVKSSISGATLSENVPWFLGILTVV